MNAREHKRVLIAVSDDEIKRESFYLRLWTAVRNLGISSPQYPEVLSMFLLDIGRYDIEIRWDHENGEPYSIPFIDDIIPDDNGRTSRNCTMADESGCHPKFKSKQLSFLRFLFIYIQWEYPRIAALIRK